MSSGRLLPAAVKIGQTISNTLTFVARRWMPGCLLPLAEYEPGSWGPHEAVRLADDVGSWHDPEGSETDRVAAPRAA